MYAKRLIPWILFFLFSFGHALPAEDITISTYFSPNGGCKAAILAAINAHNVGDGTIRVHIYYFTSKPIADALIAAHNRSVEIVCIFDGKAASSRTSMFQYLLNSGITCATDVQHKINHNKVIILGTNRVITGSYNFTASAETQNAENLLIITSSTIATAYINDFQTHWAHCNVFSPLKAQSGSSRRPVGLRPKWETKRHSDGRRTRAVRMTARPGIAL